MKLLNIRDFSYTSSSFSFQISSKVKQTRPGTHLPCLTFKAYAPDLGLCVYTYLKEYLARTENLRGQETQLFISSQKPYKGVSPDGQRLYFRRQVLILLFFLPTALVLHRLVLLRKKEYL